MKRRGIGSLLAAVMSVCSLCAAAEKEKPLPKDLPPYGELKPFAPPPVKEAKLENGMTIWLAPVAGFPKVSLTMAVRGGYSADPKERPGIAELLATTATQGTRTRSARQLAEQLQACGGDLESAADTDALSLRTSVLAEKAETALVLLADVARNAVFANREVQTAKQKAASTLEAEEAEPSFLGRRALYRAVFGDHPYSVISPTKDSIEKTTAEELKSEYSRRFRPDQTALIAVGDFDDKSFEAIVRREFGSWNNPTSESNVSVPQPNYSITRTVSYVPRPNSVQTALFLGAIAPQRAQKDYQAAALANAIYGGMFGSRLVSNIREDKGYTYTPFAYVAPYRTTGLLVTRADVRNAVTGASLNEITYELNRIATTSPEDGEVEHAKRYSIGTLAVELQSQAALAERLAEYWVQSLSPGDLAREGEKLEHVSAAEIQEAGRKYFPMWRMTTVAVGEESVIKNELAPFGLEFKKVE